MAKEKSGEARTSLTPFEKWSIWLGLGTIGVALLGIFATFVASCLENHRETVLIQMPEKPTIPPSSQERDTVKTPLLSQSEETNNDRDEVRDSPSRPNDFPLLGGETPEQIHGLMDQALATGNFLQAWECCQHIPNPDKADVERLRVWKKMIDNNCSELATPRRLDEFETEHSREIAERYRSK